MKKRKYYCFCDHCERERQKAKTKKVVPESIQKMNKYLNYLDLSEVNK